jgi:hypothetical protein
VYVDIDGRGDKYLYTFVDVPREAIFNDDECQPRSIKINQAWAIYSDTQVNPLHEPPSCRLIFDQQSSSAKLAMFDGQHKSVACWMHDKDRVVVKVYMNIDKGRTIQLVNSIQSRIKKLPLSSFEHAMKFSEEWSARFLAYEDAVGTDEASEDGLFKWLKPEERLRAKAAAQAALIKDIVEAEDLKILQFVHLEGREKLPTSIITETAFKQKVITRLRHMAPLKEKGEDWQVLRAREAENVKSALNVLAEEAFFNSEGKPDLSGSDAIRRDRMRYQSALSYISLLIVKLYRRVLDVDEDVRALLEKEPTADQRAQIRQGIKRIVDHPIWTCDLDKSPKTKAVKDALSKNQDAAAAFRAVELRGDYVTGTEQLPAKWFE